MNEQEIKQLTDEEILEHIRDCVATINVLNDAGSHKYQQVLEQYLADLELLLKLGRIDEDTYNELVDQTIVRSADE